MFFLSFVFNHFYILLTRIKCLSLFHRHQYYDSVFLLHSEVSDGVHSRVFLIRTCLSFYVFFWNTRVCSFTCSVLNILHHFLKSRWSVQTTDYFFLLNKCLSVRCVFFCQIWHEILHAKMYICSCNQMKTSLCICAWLCLICLNGWCLSFCFDILVSFLHHQYNHEICFCMLYTTILAKD